jgi:hypothetical protein
VDSAGDLAGAERELGLDVGELLREAMKLAIITPFRVGESRSRPRRSSDEIRTVDGPVAKNPTRVATHRVPSFFLKPEAGTQLSAG